MIKAILFDLDGTLTDSETYYTESTCCWLKEAGIDVDRKLVNGIVGLSMDETYRYLSKISGLDYSSVKRLNEDYQKRHPLVYSDVLFDDVMPLFEELKKRGIKIAICSMSQTSYIRRCIEECSLDGYVDYYISGDTCERQKPDPEIYQKALRELGIDNKEAIAVEDSEQGIASSKAAGIYTLARNSEKLNINQSSADIIFNDIREILKLL